MEIDKRVKIGKIKVAGDLDKYYTYFIRLIRLIQD
jgi:hypothetical protein